MEEVQGQWSLKEEEEEEGDWEMEEGEPYLKTDTGHCWRLMKEEVGYRRTEEEEEERCWRVGEEGYRKMEKEKCHWRMEEEGCWVEGHERMVEE